MMPEDQSRSTKMFGYMERRGKMTIRGRWKQRWCVLEGHLLLYYKSQAEYLKLSPCCGSLNMTLVRKIQPHIGRVIHITTHSQTIILRTPNKEKQEQWFNALATVAMHSDHEGLLNNDSLVSLLPKPEKRGNRRSVRISVMHEQNHSNNVKFDSEEENNNSTKLTSMSNVIKKISSQPILKRNSYKTMCSSDSNIHASSTKNNCREFRRSFSCGCISTQLLQDQSIETESICHDSGDQNKKRGSKVHWNDAENDTVSFAENSEHVHRRHSKRRKKVIHRHSFSFLKEFLTKRKGRRLLKEAQKQQIRALQDLNNCFITSIIAVTTTLNVGYDSEEITHSQEPSSESSNLAENLVTIGVSTSNTNESIQIEGSRSRTTTESDRTSLSEVLPELPPKQFKPNCARYSWQKPELKLEPVASNPNTELDKLIMEIKDLNRNPDLRTSMLPPDDNIPDYDIPRSHLSIISEIISDPTDAENSSIGSADSRYYNLPPFSMDPDSLEMPWLSNDELNNHNYWPATSSDNFFFRDSIGYNNDDSYLDSLNT